jgi:hypothetical protein
MGETLQSKMRRLTPYVRGALRSVEVGGRHYVILTAGCSVHKTYNGSGCRVGLPFLQDALIPTATLPRQNSLLAMSSNPTDSYMTPLPSLKSSLSRVHSLRKFIQKTISYLKASHSGSACCFSRFQSSETNPVLIYWSVSLSQYY